jgi:DNA-binding NarL/FixJ family response regulator
VRKPDKQGAQRLEKTSLPVYFLQGATRGKLNLLGAIDVYIVPTTNRELCFMSDALQLTIREQEILRLIAQGYMNKKIAADLDTTEQVVKNYVSRILKKLHAVNRTEAVIKASHCGLIPLDGLPE